VVATGGFEIIELTAGGNMTSTNSGMTYRGAYRVSGGDLEYALEMPQGRRQARLQIVALRPSELVLESHLTGQRTVYRRT
jgi:hypothetical protein